MSRRIVELAVGAAVVIAGCEPLHETISYIDGHEPGTPRADARDDGRALVSIDHASGTGFVALPSGDIVVAGWSEHAFVMRMSPAGAVRWTVPFDRCQGLLVAAAGDDAIYVVDRASGTITPTGTACDKRSGDRGVLYRLRGATGEIDWRRALPIAPDWIVASSERVIGGKRGMFAVAASTGELAWTRADDDANVESAARDPDANTVIAIGSPWTQRPGMPGDDAPCVVRGVDAATGDVRWQTTVEPAASWCVSPTISVWGGRAIATTHVILDNGARGGGDTERRILGFDAATGAMLWQRRDPGDPGLGIAFAAPEALTPFAPDGPVIIDYHLAGDRVDRLGVIAINPATGGDRVIATMSARLPHGQFNSLVWISQLALRGGIVTAVGGYMGRIEVAGLHAYSPKYRDDHDGRDKMIVYTNAMYVARIPTR